MIRAAVHVALLCLITTPLLAQRVEERYGVNGSLTYTHTKLALDSAPNRARGGMTARLGVRVCALCWMDVRALSITPAVTLSATDVRGISREKHNYAFSRVDMGGQVALRVKAVRPYFAVWLKNSRTAEVDRDSLNYVDPKPGTALTFGFELPITREGRGLDIHFTRLRGKFTKAEFRKDTLPTALGYKGIAISIGWSGPFTGAGLPWR